MAKSVSDLAGLSTIILEPHARESVGKDGYNSYLSKSFEVLKVGFVQPEEWRLPEGLWKPNEADKAVLDAAFFGATAKVKEEGAAVKFPVELTKPSALKTKGKSDIGIILSYEYAKSIIEYVEILGESEVQNISDIIAYDKNHADKELPSHCPDQSRLIDAYERLLSKELYEKAVENMLKTGKQNRIHKTLDSNEIEILVLLIDSAICSMTAAARYPIAAMPLGYLDDSTKRLFGLSILAKADMEGEMFKFMSAFEAVFPKRRIPTQLLYHAESETRL